MSIITTYPFNNEANYTRVNTVVDSGEGSLNFVPNPGQIFENTFDDDTGFTYDVAKAEFVGGILQAKDQTPSNSIFAGKFDTKDLAWNKGAGGITGVLTGSPTFSAGKMVCVGNQGVYYSYVTSARETFKFKYTPNYTGAPPANVNLISSYNGTNNNDRFYMTNSPSGNNIRFDLRNSSGASVTGLAVLAAFSPVSGTEYEFEVVLDSVAGTVRLFIDGVLVGTSALGPWSRGGVTSRIYLGSTPIVYQRAEGSFDDLIIFNDAQHTASYTSGYSIVDTIYATSKIDGPTFSYTGLGTVLSLDDGSFTEAGAPRYIVGLQYWNGSAWVVSDGSYAQANDSATILANILAFDTGGGGVLPWSVVFPDSNTQASIDEFSIEVTGQQYAAEGTLLTNSSFVASEISDFDSEETTPANTSIGYALEVGGVNKYHNGTSWVDSDGTSAESNTLAEIQANIDSLLTANSAVKVLVIMTGDQLVTPSIDLISVTYDFGALEPVDPNQCQVFGFLKNAENVPVVGATVTIRPNRDFSEYVEAAERIIATSIEKTTDSNGFFSSNLIISDDFEVGGAQAMQFILTVTIDGQALPISKNGENSILFEVPNQASVNITEQIGAI